MGRNDFYIAESSEIFDVKRKQVLNFVDPHRRHQTRVVHLYPGYIRADNDPAPLFMRLFALRSKAEFCFDKTRPFVGLCDGETEPVSVCGPGTHIPEFAQVLRSIKEVRALRPQQFRRSSYYAVLRTIGLYQS